ncbi:site-specific integrase [Bdellovibrionota bacterium FG-1]
MATLLFPTALKSFLGYLEGTSKAQHTIKNYRLDLLAFESFLRKDLGDRPLSLGQLSSKDLDRFHEHLKESGQKTNTRRRKLLTVRRFLSFLVKRKKLPIELGKKISTPHKIERVPKVLSSETLIATIRALPHDTFLDARNRAMLWTLAETGCQVSELAALRFEDWSANKVQIRGKAPRLLAISSDLRTAVDELKKYCGDRPWVFLGFNKLGPLGGAISPRGVELLVQFHAPRLGQVELTPRTFRHSIVIHWYAQGCTLQEIQNRLGLKTQYAFRSYEPLFKSVLKSKSETTSNP